jgi:hypothetical protein
MTWSDCSARLLSTGLASPSMSRLAPLPPPILANRGERLGRGLAA